MKELAEFWEDMARTFPGCKMTSLMTDTFGCGHYTPKIKTGDRSVLELETVDLGPLPRPRAEILEVRAYALARHLIENLDRTEVLDLMGIIKLHEPPEFIDSVRKACKNLSTNS
tara:strand:+ start:122 stop:463 length:342 start_codon:yes stop_codon:yes gene_type:complete